MIIPTLTGSARYRRHGPRLNARTGKPLARRPVEPRAPSTRTAPQHSILGYVGTIRADRRDYELMLRYMRARIREDARHD